MSPDTAHPSHLPDAATPDQGEGMAEGFTIMHGVPTEEELAAVILVLTAVTAAPPPARENDDRPRAGGWTSHWRLLRQPFVPGRDAWRGLLR